MAHDSSRQQAMVTDVPVATVVNGEQLMPLVLVHERTLAVWVIVGPAADAALGATNVPAAAANRHWSRPTARTETPTTTTGSGAAERWSPGLCKRPASTWQTRSWSARTSTPSGFRRPTSR